jgi:hypothetical protein
MVTALVPVTAGEEPQAPAHGTNDGVEAQSRGYQPETEPEFSDDVDYALNGVEPVAPSPSDAVPLTAESSNGQTEEDWEMAQRDTVDNMLGAVARVINGVGSEKPEEDERKESSGKDSGEEDADASSSRRRQRGVNEDDTDATHNPGSGSEVGIRMGEVPHVVAYHEHVIHGSQGSLVIGAADVALPGVGITTVSRSAFLSRRDYNPMDTVDLSDPVVGGFFDEIAAPFHAVARAAGRFEDRIVHAMKNAVEGIDSTTFSGRLMPGQRLRAGQNLWSRNKRALLLFQTNGNLSWWAASPDANGDAVQNPPPWNMWQAWITGKGGTDLLMQTDGNLVVLNRAGQPVWYTGTPGHPGGFLIIGDDGELALADSQGLYWALGTSGFKKAPGTPWYRGKQSPLASVVETMKSVANTAAALTPVGLVSHILHGERIDHALVGAFKDNLSAVKSLAPYAQTVASFVPGLGTGVAGAIAGAAALAEGRPITEAMVDAVKGAVPGGALGQMAFETAKKVAAGGNFVKSSLESARNLVPEAARPAFDIGLAVFHGKNLQDAVKAGAVSALSSVAEKAGSSALSSLAHQTLVSNVANAAKSLVSNAAGTSGKMLGMAVNVPGATANALASYGSAVEALKKIALAKSAVNEGQALVQRLAGRTPTAAEQAIITKARAGALVSNAAIDSIKKLNASAASGDSRATAKLAILKIAKTAMNEGAGQHGHFVTDTGQILKGSFAPVA